MWTKLVLDLRVKVRRRGLPNPLRLVERLRLPGDADAGQLPALELLRPMRTALWAATVQ
eukprot:COSAG06_NODE_46734_length_344_cov_1.257143_1_plen_58_part_10